MPNSTWKVTNATTKKNLVVINASVDSDVPAAFYYEAATILLPFSSGKLLPPGGNGNITIPAVNKDSNGYDLPFTFIIAEAETLAPIKAVSFNADLSDLRDLSIDDNMVNNITPSFDFYKNITALPASELATNFAALDLTDAAAVAAFFDATDDYKKVTLNTLLLVSSYYTTLPYGWANKKDIVIYLYSEKNDDGADEGTMKSTGTIKITNNWSQPLPLTPADSFKVNLLLNDEAAQPLYYSKGIFRNNLDASKATVCLAASFFIPGLVLDDNDNIQLCTYVAGSINAVSVFGFEGAQPDGVDDNGSFWKLLDVHNFRDGFTLAMYGIGIIAAIVLLVKVGQFLKWCKERGNPAVEPAKRAAQADQLAENLGIAIRVDLTEANQYLAIPKLQDIRPEQVKYTQAQLKAKTYEGYRNVQKMVAVQEKILMNIGSKCSNAVVQEIADRIDYVRRKCEMFETATAANIQKFREQMPDTVKVLSDNASEIGITKVKIASRLNKAEAENYDRAMEVFDKIFKAQLDLSKEVKGIEEGRDEREIIEEPVEG